MPKHFTNEQLQQRIEELDSTILSMEERHIVHRMLFENLDHEVHVWRLVFGEKGEILTWRLVDVNQKGLSSWGKSIEEVIGKRAEDIFPNGDPIKEFLPIIENVFTNNAPYQWETYFSGTDQTLAMTTIPVGDLFISTGIDVTLYKKTEEQLQEALLQLQESIDAGKVGIWNWEIKDNKVTFSKEYKQQIGYTEHELEDSFDVWKSRLHPDDLDICMNNIEETLETKAEYYENAFRLRHRNGSYIWIYAHARVFYDAEDNPSRMIGSHVDITQVKQLEISLSQTQKIESLGKLACGIAHDFNNLLTPILGYANLALENEADNQKIKSYLKKIKSTSVRAKDLVKKILMVSRSSTSKVENLELSSLVEEVLAVINASAQKNISIKTDFETNLPRVLANVTEIYQVILNLCTNAIQAMDNRSGRLYLSVSRVPELSLNKSEKSRHGYVLLKIQDEGCGMSSYDMEHLYDPFYTTKQKPGERGTGLGMSIVSNVIKNIGGYIDVESEVDVGTTFSVYFPASVEKTTEVEEQLLLNCAKSQAHIMVVDDEDMNCELCEEILIELGFAVTPFTDAISALDAFESAPSAYDLIVTDYSMPNMSGPELIQRVKQISPDIPLLLLTGHSNLESVASIAEIGCDGVLAKPFTIKALNQSIQELLQSKK